jgi:putative transposase
MIPVNCSKSDFEYLHNCNRLSAEVWNLCIKLDKEYQEQNGKQIMQGELQRLTKKCVNLHAKGIHHVVIKYLTSREAMWRSRKADHSESSKVKLPYKEKKYFVTGWDYQCLRVDYESNIISLAKPVEQLPDVKLKYQKPVRIKCKSIPQNIVEVELVYKDKYYLAIKYKEQSNKYYQIKSDNVAAIDLGEIHSITSIDNNGNAVIITGRKLRSIKYFRNKELGKLRSKLSKCIKDSQNYWDIRKTIKKLTSKTERKVLDSVHKISKLYLDYCLENQINKVYYGDLDSCTRNTSDRVRKVVGQKLNQWCYGLLMLQLQNKLSRYGIELVKIPEYYTSKKCPRCSMLNTPKGRNYKCECGYKQHRDINGAINILNDNSQYHVERYLNLKYLQIA